MVFDDAFEFEFYAAHHPEGVVAFSQCWLVDAEGCRIGVGKLLKQGLHHERAKPVHAVAITRHHLEIFCIMIIFHFHIFVVSRRCR